jgi:hypothetical protein
MRIVIFFFLTFLSFQTIAETSNLNLYQLSEDVRDIVLKAPGGHPMPEHEFTLTSEQSDQMEALSGVDDSIKVYLENAENSDCEESFSITQSQLKAFRSRVDNRSYKIEAVVIASNAKMEESALSRFRSDDYMNFMSEEYGKGNYKSADIFSVKNLESKYKATHPEVKFDFLSLKEKENLLNDYAEKYLGKALPVGLLMKEIAYQNLKEHSADWKQILATAKEKLSSEQKIQLVSKLGGIMGDNYNFDRSEAGKAEYGKFVKMEELLDSANKGTPGGICRDIALAQTQMLQELGFKNNYVLAFKSLEGSHATVITTDPETGKIVKFNYDESTQYSKESGTNSLTQDTTLPDYGTNFRIYDTNGKPVTRVPSELGQILKSSVSAESDREFNQKNFSLSKVGFSTPYVNGNLFVGKTSSGDEIYGVALFKDVVNNDYLKVNVGTSLSERKASRSQVTIDQQTLFVLGNAEISSPALKLGATETKVFGGTEASFYVTNATEVSKKYGTTSIAKGENEGEIDYKLGVENIINSENKKISIDSKVYANFYPDWNHVASVEKRILVTDSIVVRSGVTYNFNDDTRALIDTAIVMKNYGTSIISKAIVEDEKRGMRYVAGVAAPLTKDMPSFLPGSERRVFGSIEHQSKKLIFSIEVERNLDNKNTSVSAKGQYKF